VQLGFGGQTIRPKVPKYEAIGPTITEDFDGLAVLGYPAGRAFSKRQYLRIIELARLIIEDELDLLSLVIDKAQVHGVARPNQIGAIDRTPKQIQIVLKYILQPKLNRSDVLQT